MSGAVVRLSLWRQVRRVDVTDELAGGHRYHYADAFELRLEGPDPVSPRTWLSAGLDDSPAVLTTLTALLLGVRDERATAPDDLSDWTVRESTPDLIRVERTLPLLHVVLIGRRLDTSGRRLTTLLSYQRPVLSRLVWTVVGVGHRLLVRRLICHGLSAATVGAGPARSAAPPGHGAQPSGRQP
jgi:hypothetical protein